MQFEAIRTISIMDTMKVTPDTGAEEIKQKNLLTNLLKLAKRHGQEGREPYTALC